MTRLQRPTTEREWDVIERVLMAAAEVPASLQPVMEGFERPAVTRLQRELDVARAEGLLR